HPTGSQALGGGQAGDWVIRLTRN
ncbi:MAG: hypothetical protein RL304_669, partial [Verrucomicrobiota bacterium]